MAIHIIAVLWRQHADVLIVCLWTQSLYSVVAPRLVPVLLFVILLYIYNYIFKCILYCGDNYILYNICILIHSILSYIYSISSFLRSFCWDKFCANIQSFTLGPCLDKNCLCSSCTALGDENPNHSTQTLKKSVMVALWSDMIKYDQIWSVEQRHIPSACFIASLPSTQARIPVLPSIRC